MKIILSNSGHPVQSVDEMWWPNPQCHRVLQQKRNNLINGIFPPADLGVISDIAKRLPVNMKRGQKALTH